MTMKNRWPTFGIPMACPRCTAAYPCRFSRQREVTMPLDMPLSINTNIQYNLDEEKFPGLDSGNKELTLMMAPVGVAAIPTSLRCPVQTLVSTPLPSEDMQCSSGYVSEEDIICLDKQDLDTPGIVSLIESFREESHQTKNTGEPRAKRKKTTHPQTCRTASSQVPSCLPVTVPSLAQNYSFKSPHTQNKCLSQRTNMTFVNNASSFRFAKLPPPMMVPQGSSYVGSGLYRGTLGHSIVPSNQNAHPCFPIPNMLTTTSAYHNNANSNPQRQCGFNLQPVESVYFGSGQLRDAYGLPHGVYHNDNNNGRPGFYQVSRRVQGGIVRQAPYLHNNIPASMHTGGFNNSRSVTPGGVHGAVNWGSSVSNPIYV